MLADGKVNAAPLILGRSVYPAWRQHSMRSAIPKAHAKIAVDPKSA